VAHARPATYGKLDTNRLVAASSEPGNWYTNGRDFGESYFSPLDQINGETVGRLGFAWEYRLGTKRGLEATPIVIDGVMYTSGPYGITYALNARNGEMLWTFDPSVDGQTNRKVCCDAVNRGVAVWDGKVYVAALDGRLFALDAETGDIVWQVETIADDGRGTTSTGAPAIAGNVVVIGNSGADLDARGYISAYDVESGEFAWRFYTVPGDPKLGFEHPELEMAAKTWDPNSRWDIGLGGTVWDALVYDPELNLLYAGTGNGAPYHRADRSPDGGDNLFLTSILAINPDSGRLVWHFQTTPGDSWDYTATQPIILADLEIDGRIRKVLMQAPKNGFFYVLDRETGQFLSARNYAPQNWASYIDPTSGAATVDREAADYADEMKLVTPSVIGAHAWHPMAYSKKSGLVYIPTIDAANYFFDPTLGHDYRPGLRNEGIVMLFAGEPMFPGSEIPAEFREQIEDLGTLDVMPDMNPRGRLRAWNPVAQELVWELETAGPFDRSGVLATAGGLVIQGTVPGYLRVMNDETGKILREIKISSSVVAGPMSYEIDGEQYIAVMAGIGGGVYTFAPPPESAAYQYGNAGRIIAFKLDGGPMPMLDPLPPIEPLPEPPALTASADVVARGEQLYMGTCIFCHLSVGRGYPQDLRRLTPEKHAVFNDIVLNGTLRPLGMPQWDDVLSKDDVDAIHAFIISRAWDGFNAEQEQNTGGNAEARAD
jgi:quinohemoprotein ethanol dehydrogenase